MSEKDDWRKGKRKTGGSIKTVKGKLYARIQYLDEQSGKRKEKLRSAKSRTHAKQLIDQMRRELSEVGQKTLEADKMTFLEVAEIYEKTKIIPPVYVGSRKVAGLRSHRQTKVHLKPLKEYFGRMTAKQIKASDVQKYKLDRLNKKTVTGAERAISSVNRELALLRSIFNYAKSENWILRSPFEAKGFGFISLVDENKREKILTPSEEKRLLAACTGEREIKYTRNGKEITAIAHVNLEYLRAIIVCALDTAMRKGEILKLVWADIDFINNELRVRAFNSKTAAERIVGMTSRLKAELGRLWEFSPKNENGLVFGINDFKKSFKSVCDAASIEGLRFHDLRHTAITRLVEMGLPTAEIMKISGHKQTQTFLRYVNPSRETTQRHAEALERYLEANNPQIKTDSTSEMVN
jgi:integrase